MGTCKKWIKGPVRVPLQCTQGRNSSSVFLGSSVGVSEALSFIFTSKLPDERDATGLTACCLSSSFSANTTKWHVWWSSFHLLPLLRSLRRVFERRNFSFSFYFGRVLKRRRRPGAPSGPAGTLRGFYMSVSGSFVFPTFFAYLKVRREMYNFHFLAVGRFETFQSRL